MQWDGPISRRISFCRHLHWLFSTPLGLPGFRGAGRLRRNLADMSELRLPKDAERAGFTLFTYCAISYMGPAAAGLLSGSFVVETIFQIPGLGRFFISSALDNDYTMIMGCVMLYSVFIIAFNLLSDFLLAAVNPKIAKEMRK